MHTATAAPIKAQSWFLLILLSVVWGSSFILMKKGLEVFSPFQVASLRIGFAALCLLPVAIQNIGRIKRRDLFYIGAFGLCNAGLPAFLFAMAQTRVNSSTAGILNALTPIFTLLVGVIFFSVKLTNRKMAGVLIGFAGAAMLVVFKDGVPEKNILQDSNFYFTLMIIFATLLYGFSGNIMKHYLQNIPGKIISSYAYLIYALPLVAVLFFTDFLTLLQQPFFTENTATGTTTITQMWVSLGYIAFLGVVGSAIAIVLFSKLVKDSSALFGSFTTYLLPFVAIFWGAMAGENISIFSFLSLGVIIFGILITNKKHKKIT